MKYVRSTSTIPYAGISRDHSLHEWTPIGRICNPGDFFEFLVLVGVADRRGAGVEVDVEVEVIPTQSTPMQQVAVHTRRYA